MCVGSPLAVEPADRDRPRLVADAGDPDLERPGWQEGQELVRPLDDRHAVALQELRDPEVDRKSTRLNSSHTVISYAVFCLKKKKKTATARLSSSRSQAHDDRETRTD